MVESKFEGFFGANQSKRFAEAIRSAKSWRELEADAKRFKYDLYPSVDDIIAVNRVSRHSMPLSDSSHFFYFIVERLGHPPAHLAPRDYYPPDSVSDGRRRSH